MFLTPASAGVFFVDFGSLDMAIRLQECGGFHEPETGRIPLS